MVEGILILVGVTSYYSIVTVINNQQYSMSSGTQNEAFWIMLLFGWIWFPFWVIYKFWEWLIVGLPKQIKEWSRKKNDK